MTNDDICAWLDTHCLPGRPSQSIGGDTWIVAECRNGPDWPAYIDVLPVRDAGTRTIVRHAVLQLSERPK